ncbi:MAG: tetratricopeptide repeat protein [Myxococcales bacterium]|nr:tetratricopeptide repeat protein [Myxococcales bacterium]
MTQKIRFLLIACTIIFPLFMTTTAHSQAPETEDAAWAKIQKLLVEPDDNRDDLFNLLDAFREAYPESAHKDEVALWMLKITTDFKDPNTVRFVDILESLAQSAAQTEVRGEALFWKAHILYSSVNIQDGLAGFRQYLERFSDGPRADQARLFLSLEDKIEETRRNFLTAIHATLKTVAEKKMFEIGLRVQLYSNSLDARLALTADRGSSIRATAPWMNFHLYTGAEGLFVHLPDDKTLLRFPTDLHMKPTLVWNADQINLGFISTQQPAEPKPTVDVKPDEVIPVLADRLATLHLSQSGRDFRIYNVGLLPPASQAPSSVFSFDRDNRLANVLFNDRHGAKLLEVSEITFAPQPDKSPVKAPAKQVRELAITDISLANAGSYLFATIEKRKAAIPDYESLMQAKPTVMALLSQLDGILSLVRASVTNEEKLAQVDAQLKAGPADAALLSRRATLLTDLRRLDEAEQAVAQVKTALGETPEAILLEAEFLVAKNEPARARELLATAVAKYPQNGALLGRYAQLLFYENASEAMRLAAQAIDLDPTQTDAYRFLASVYLKVGMTDEALRVLNAGIQKAAAPDELRTLQGLILFNAGRLEEAREAVKSILDAPPSEQTPMAKMIELMVNLKKADAGQP